MYYLALWSKLLLHMSGGRCKSCNLACCIAWSPAPPAQVPSDASRRMISAVESMSTAGCKQSQLYLESPQQNAWGPRDVQSGQRSSCNTHLPEMNCGCNSMLTTFYLGVASMPKGTFLPVTRKY